MAHIHNTLVKRKLAEDAKEWKTSYRKYQERVGKAKDQGYAPATIIDALEAEKQNILADIREGDGIYQLGVKNAKTACIEAINNIISELKKEKETNESQ